MKRIIAGLLLIFALTGSSIAQKKWTLEECINHAIEQNLSLKSAKISSENEAIRYEQARINDYRVYQHTGHNQ